MDITSQAQDLESAFTKLQGILGKKVDWSYYNQMKLGLKVAGNDEQRINIITHFADKLKTDVLPMLQVPQTNTPAEAGSQDVPPPKGGGFAPLPYHPRVINGEYFHPVGKVTIRG